jgi:uncharacterized protein (DUF924 family)
MSRVEAIIKFWFGAAGSENYGCYRPWWFLASPETDRHIQKSFTNDYEFAAAGYLDGWQGWPWSCLALILLLDQIPRNLFRGQPETFATDAMALEIAKQAILNGVDQEFLPVQRWFFYLPLEHSENLADQIQCLELFLALPEHPDKHFAVAAAQQHHKIIKEFGRFPHRNQVLGKVSTSAELAYLEQPDAFHL